ncbi:hypothetical protein Cfor_06107, partial [Coptotermes formosanus]
VECGAALEGTPVCTTTPSSCGVFQHFRGPCRLLCTREPPPQLAWSLGEGSPVVQIADLRLVHTNVSLVFPPFPVEHYLHDIHTALNRCKAQNQTGIFSAGLPTCGS